MSLLQTGIAKSGAVSDYEIDNSLRLDDGDSAYLSRTMSTPTNNKNWTLSTWFKRGNFTQGQLLSAGGNQVFILGATQFSFAGGASGTTERMKTTQLFRDPSAWYHIVFSMDTTQSAFSDQMKLYVNGTQVTAFDTSTAITQNDNTQINSAIAHRVGGYSGGGEHWDGYLAEYYFVDGSVLDADDFGELDSDTNQWIPLDSDDVKDAVSFGTNGFFQKYNSTELAASFEDSSSGIFQGSDFSAVTTTMSIGTGTIGLIIDGTTTASSGCIPTGSQTVSAQNVTFDCGSGVTKIFTHAEFIVSNTYDDGDWKWQGSNDNVSYSDIGSGNFTIQGSTAEGPPIDITAGLSSNTTAYRYYRWQGVSGTTTASNFWTEIVNLRTAPPGTGFHTITAEGHTYNQRPQPHDVTANGDAHLIGNKVGTSAAFDGDGDYLTASSSTDFDFGSAAFTVEGWYNITAPDSGGDGWALMGNRQGSAPYNGWMVEYFSDTMYFYFHNGSNINVNWDWTPSNNTWYHLAFARSGDTIDFWINGVSQGSQAITGTFTASSAGWKLGGQPSSTNYDLFGYIGPQRISTTARYTVGSDFTPDTSVWVNDSDTKLLIQDGTDGSQTFDDLSTGDHTISVTGSVHWIAPKVGAGAIAFDGSSDYLSVANPNNDFGFGTGDFTIEMWAKFNAAPTTEFGLIANHDYGVGGWQLTYDGDGDDYFHLWSSDQTDYDLTGAVTPSAATWYHYAIARQDDTLRFYINGVQQTSQSFTEDMTNTAVPLMVGAYADTGAGAMPSSYVDGVRVSKLCRYPDGTTFDVPTTAFTDDINTVLLLNADINQGTWAEDQSTGLAISTDSRMKFDGTGDFLEIPDSTDWDFGDGDFTWECWINFSQLAVFDTGLMTIFSSGTGVGSDYWALMWGDGTYTGETGIGFGDKGQSSYNFWQGDQSGWEANRWYHLAFVRDGSDITIYRDGTSFLTNSSMGTLTNYADTLQIGDQNDQRFFGGWMDEIRFSNSVRYTENFTPKARGEQFTADANTKLLIHSDYTGGLGADSSGNYNNFTATNLVATDQMIDTPTNNFATFNPLIPDTAGNKTFSEGNLEFTTNGDGSGCFSTIGMDSGKWYAEFYCIEQDNAAAVGILGDGYVDNSWGSIGDGAVYVSSDGTKNIDGSSSAYGNTWDDGDIISVALDMDGGTVTCYKNGVSEGEMASGLTGAKRFGLLSASGLSSPSRQFVANFGSDGSFAGNKTAQGNQDDNDVGDFYYEPPSGYLALCTDNLSAALDVTLPGEYFNTIIWSGAQSGSSAPDRSFTGVGFQPDFVWSKSRSNANQHNLQNSVATLGDSLNSDATAVAGDTKGSGYLSSLDSDGFTSTAGASGVINWDESGRTYVAWNWKAGGAPTADNSAGAGATPTAGSVKIDGSNLGSALAGSIAATRLSANTTAGFSIVKFQNNATSGATVAHGLGVTPELIITKMIDGTYSWYTYCKYMDATAPEDYYMELNEAGGKADSATDGWNDTLPTSSVFSLGDGGSNSLGSKNVIAYCFTSIEGYSKVGSYEGNGNVDGTFIYCGFKPACIIVKDADTSARNWFIFDNKRNPYNVVDEKLYPNLSIAETTPADAYDFISNGLKVRSTDANWNTSGDSYIYIAFAESPFKTANAR
jgi:hypothetical protein